MIIESFRKTISGILGKIDCMIYNLSLINLSKPSLREENLIEELRNEIIKIPNITSKAESKIDVSWVSKLHKLILKEDPRKFLSWEVIRKTLFIRRSTLIYQQLNFLKRKTNWNDTWKKIIDQCRIGFPEKHMKFVKSVNNHTINRLYHLARFKENTKISIEKMDFTIEFGGGYGNLCRLIHFLGFKGKYIIYDLPVVSSLQRYFLKSNSIKVINNLEEFVASKTGVYCVSDMNILSKIVSNSAKTLFIATWSISEVGLDLRNKFLSIPIVKECNNHLISYSDKFCGIDNLKFFKGWSNDKKNLHWTNIKIAQFLKHNYTFGYIKHD